MKINYMAKAFLLFGFLFLNTVFIYGQPSAARNTAAKQPQWEYLVVSFGKVYFSDPLTDPETKASGSSKLISFSREGIVIANEGVTTQRSMDILGRFGWELVGAVGAIGGDQEMLFKRPYDETRSKQEEDLIKKEGERIRNLIQEERAKSASLQTVTTELIDLDSVESTEARNANRRNQEDRLKKAAEAIKDYPLSIESVVSDAYSAKDTRVSIIIAADATTTLLTDGNKYRSSQAKQTADNIAFSVVGSAGVKQRKDYGLDSSINYSLGKVKITVNVIINFNGKKKVVATSRTGGDW